MILNTDYDTVTLQKITYGVIKITPPKIRHQNDVKKFSVYKPHSQQEGEQKI